MTISSPSLFVPCTPVTNCDFLTEEVLGLERLSDGHIEHPEAGTQGSKDAIDAVVGSLWNAAQHAEEFAYDYGESFDTIFNTNDSSNEDQNKKQLVVNFEEELMKMGNPLGNTNNNHNDYDDYGPYVADDMIIW